MCCIYSISNKFCPCFLYEECFCKKLGACRNVSVMSSANVTLNPNGSSGAQPLENHIGILLREGHFLSAGWHVSVEAMTYLHHQITSEYLDSLP